MKLVSILLCLFLISTATAADCPRTVAEVSDSEVSRLFWYGTETLAVRIPRDGFWYGMGPERSYGDKLFIRSAGFRPPQESSLSVRGRRIDGDGQLAEISQPTNAHAFGGWAMLVGVSLPSSGCWEFVVGYLGRELTFVVEARSQAKASQGVAAPPNNALQQTFDPAALFAAAKSTAASNAAELGRYVSQGFKF